MKPFKKQQVLLALLLVLPLSAPAHAGVEQKTDRMREGLVGPVKRVLVEIATIEQRQGGTHELPRIPWTSTEYNRRGMRVLEDQLYRNSALDFKSVFRYDGSGRLESGVEYDAKGIETFKWTYTYSASGEKVEERRIQADGKLFSTRRSFYDAQGNLIKEEYFPPHTKNHFRWIFRYDLQGRKLEERYILLHPDPRSGKVTEILNFHTVFSYDPQGVLLREVRQNGFGELEWDKHYDYKYDKEGNWIYRKASQPQGLIEGAPLVPSDVTYRTISYF